jgi:hypothetical protein
MVKRQVIVALKYGKAAKRGKARVSSIGLKVGA